MTWLRDMLLAALWSVVSVGCGVAMGLAGLYHGLVPLAAVIIGAPYLAYRTHNSRRVAWLVAGISGVLVLTGVILIWHASLNFRFRAIQG